MTTAGRGGRAGRVAWRSGVEGAWEVAVRAEPARVGRSCPQIQREVTRLCFALLLKFSCKSVT